MSSYPTPPLPIQRQIPIDFLPNPPISLLIILLEVWSVARKYVFNPPKVRFYPVSLPHISTVPFRLVTTPRGSKISPSNLFNRVDKKSIQACVTG
jgi:hypothetical protein